MRYRGDAGIAELSKLFIRKWTTESTENVLATSKFPEEHGCINNVLLKVNLLYNINM